MDEASLRQKIAELISEARGMPAAHRELTGLAEPYAQSPSPLRREMAALEDGLEHLRLAIKYLVFDLEATKRENEILRQMLG